MMADNKDSKKNKSIFKEIEELKASRLHPHRQMKEQAVMNALTAGNASTEARRQSIFKPVREMLEAHGDGNELRSNLEEFAKF